MQRTANKGHHARAPGTGMRIAVVVSRFNEDVTSRLLDGALECLRDHGVRPQDQQVIWCPGAFELPQAADAVLRRTRWDGVVCLGAVIRGETAHFDYVASGAAQGIQLTALKFGIPVGFGVLTTDTLKQAMERAGGRHGNKGRDTAAAVISMVQIQKDLYTARKRERSGRKPR